MDQPLSIAELGIPEDDFQERLEKLLDDALNDTKIVTAVRPSSYQELENIFAYAYRGKTVDYYPLRTPPGDLHVRFRRTYCPD